MVVGLIVFSAYRGASGEKVTITIWGSMEEIQFSDIVRETSLYQNDLIKLEYKKKPEETFDADFVEALAAGEGPDLFIIPSDKIVKHQNKILTIPYSVFSERQFKEAFIEGAEIFTTLKGITALPVSVDPLVMYWNRSILNEAKVTTAPKYWDEFYDLASLISRKDGALNIQRSVVAFGEFGNVSHAKDIIAMLCLQAGTPITAWQGDKIQSVLSYNFNKPTLPADAAVNFYTEFSNPAKATYSWNRSLPSSYDYFLSGDLALYFGPASEIGGLRLKNPNLNFDVAPVPMSREGGESVVFGKFFAIAVTKSSKKANTAFTAASILAGEGAKTWSEVTGLPPVQRSLLAIKQERAHTSVFYDGAIRARGWLDPEPLESNMVFRNMIESITSGRARTSEAVSRASRELDSLLVK